MSSHAQAPESVAARATPVETITFGMSTAISGPSADLGNDARAGVAAAFARYNARHESDGRRVVLRSFDDGYEPTRTVPNMRKLCEDADVVGILANVGTPTALAALPIARRTNMPFVGAITGTGFLRRDPPDSVVVNYRASYAEETAAMVDALITLGRLQPLDIAFFAQRDSFGDAGCTGGIDALVRNGLEDPSNVVIGTFERNTLAVEDALADLLLAEHRPRAVILVGTYAPCAKFIRLARSHGLDCLFLNVSFVGSESLARELGDQGEGVLITQVVPPLTADVPIVAEYFEDMARAHRDSTRTLISFEGYVVGRMVTRALEDVPGTPTRTSVLESLLGLGEFDLGLGFPLRLGPTSRQASHRVWPTVLRRGRVESFDWADLPRALEAH